MRRAAVILVAAAAVGVTAMAGPAAQDCRAQAGGSGAVEPRLACPGVASKAPAACASAAGFRRVSATPRARGVRFAFSRTGGRPVTVELFQVSIGSRIVGNRRVARVSAARSGGAFAGRRLRDGYFFARFTTVGTDGRKDVRRVALRRLRGRFASRSEFDRRERCGLIQSSRLARPVFGGGSSRGLELSYRLSSASRVTVTLRRGTRVVRRFARGTQGAGRTHRLRLPSSRIPRGDVVVELRAAPKAGGAVTRRLLARRL